jgi:hypothetical protein
MAVNHVINHAGVAFLHRAMEKAEASIDRVVAAYLKAEAESGAPALRERLAAESPSAEAETIARVELEDALESLTLAALEGKRAPASAEAMAPVLARLGS